mgnify:CR=1 FL=1
MRIGFGFDIHRLEAGRPLLIGGVSLPSEKGPQGHSDADVLLHALCDALIGAVGKGDMGLYFPDTDPQWKDTASSLFIERAMELVGAEGFGIANVDLTILAETPKMNPHRQKIVASVAKLLSVEEAQVNFKAKTMEGLGSIGEGQAIGAQAAVLLQEK